MSAHAWVAALIPTVIGLAAALVWANHKRSEYRRAWLYRVSWEAKHYEGTHDGPYDLEMKGYRRG